MTEVLKCINVNARNSKRSITGIKSACNWNKLKLKWIKYIKWKSKDKNCKQTNIQRNFNKEKKILR